MHSYFNKLGFTSQAIVLKFYTKRKVKILAKASVSIILAASSVSPAVIHILAYAMHFGIAREKMIGNIYLKNEKSRALFHF